MSETAPIPARAAPGADTFSLAERRESARAEISRAAGATGADFDYLLRTAARESNFDPAAEARTSSAAGLFQFIEQTWLGVMSRHGEAHGFSEAAQITRDAEGRYQIADPEQREAVLALRFDSRAASLMAGELTRENADVLEARLGRKALTGELYAAHFLGANGAANLIEKAQSQPALRADQLFPQAAAANRSIFFDGARARSVSEVTALLTGESVRGAAPAIMPHSAAPLSAAGGAAVRQAAETAWALTGELSPMIVEILAGLDAPERASEADEDDRIAAGLSGDDAGTGRRTL